MLLCKRELSYLNFFFDFLIEIESLNLALYMILISIYVSMDKICLIKSKSKVGFLLKLILN
jgi:hypothetical protein